MVAGIMGVHEERDHVVDERVAAVFEPDTLLATQYFDRLRRSAEHDGERRLMVAVLEDGVHTYTKYAAVRDPRGEELFAEAEAWVEDRDASWFYSFENVCAVLGLDADYLRRGLRAVRARAGRIERRRPMVELRAEPAGEEPLRKASGD
jgi:hypothetical protein